MKKIYFNNLILLSSLAMMLYACKDDYPRNRYPLTKADKQMIPYNLGDTVFFLVKDQTDTVAFIVTDDIWRWRDWPAADEYVVEQRRTVCLASDSYEYPIYVKQWVYPMDQRVIHINQWHNGVLLYGHSVRYDRKGRFLLGDVTYEPYNRPTSGPWHQEVLDSLRIGDHVYYDVLRYTYPSDSSTLLYNKTYGLLQIKEGEEPILTRVP